MAGPWEDYKSMPWEDYGGSPEPATFTKTATEPNGLGSRVYDAVLGRPQGDYAGSVRTAIQSALPDTNQLDAAGQANEMLAPKIGANAAAAIATIMKLGGNLPETVGKAGMAAMGTLWEGSYIPTAIRHGAGAVGDLVEYGTGSKVAGDVAGNAINYPAQFLAPGGVTRGVQRGAQMIGPKLPGSSDALRTMATENFASTLGTKQIEANKQVVKTQQAFDALGNERLPIPNAIAAIDSAISTATSQPLSMGAATKSVLEKAKATLAANGNGLSPQELQAWMTDIGRQTKALSATPGEHSVGDIFKPIFGAIATDASTPVVRTVSTTPRAKAPVLGLPAPGESYPVAGGRFEAGQMDRTVQVPPRKGRLELPPPSTTEVPTGTVGVGGYGYPARGETIEAGRIPTTKQVQSPPPERGPFTVYEEGGRARLEPKQYIAPTSGEVPYSGVEIMREGARPIPPGGSVLGRRQVALTPEGQAPFRDPSTGELIAKELKDPWKPGEPVTSFSITENAARPVAESAINRRQSVLSPAEQRAFRDPESGAIVAPGTRTQYADTSGQVVLDYRAAIAQEKGLKEIQKVFDKLIANKTQGVAVEGFENMNGNKMLAWFNDSRNFKKLQGIPEADIADLEAIAVKIAELPPLSPRGNFGSGRIAAVTGIVGGVASLMGVPPTIAYGTASTLGALPTISRMLLPSAIGRKALRAVLESGPIDQTKMNMLIGLARGMAESSQIADEIKKSLGYSEVPLKFKQQAAIGLGALP